MKRRGMSLIELMVAMTIFIIVMTLAVGAFLAISKIKTIGINMKESQQKVRIATEMVSRLSRQAETVSIEGKTLKLIFTTNPTTKYQSKFYIEATGLSYSECLYDSAHDKCSGTESKINLLANTGNSVTIDEATSSFSKRMAAEPILGIKINGKVNTKAVYGEDTFAIDTSVILENLK